MIKLIFCLRRHPDFDLAGFQVYWRDRHAPLVREVASALHLRKYLQSHSFADPRIAPAIDARGGTIAPYDGVAELYWDSIDDLLAAGSTPEAREAGRRLLEDERKFIDLAESPLFWVSENSVI